MHLSATQYLTEAGKSFRYAALHRAKHNTTISDATMAVAENYLTGHLTLITRQTCLPLIVCVTNYRQWTLYVFQAASGVRSSSTVLILTLNAG